MVFFWGVSISKGTFFLGSAVFAWPSFAERVSHPGSLIRTSGVLILPHEPDDRRQPQQDVVPGALLSASYRHLPEA